MDSSVSVGAADAVASAPRGATGRRAFWLCVLVVAVLMVPLVVALFALSHPRWIPLLDMAETEMRVRDVWSDNPPLIGLAGRIGPFGPDGGSHPGPLSFVLLWPFWLLFGKTAFGMFVGTVALDLGAISLAVWMAYRRAGTAAAVSIGLVLAVVMRAYGAYLLTLPWNPYLPVLWWFVFLLAAWSLLDDDFAMLPVAVFAGSMATQTHISYVGLVGGLTAFLVIAIAWSAYRNRDDKDARRSLLRWGLVSLAFGIVLWIPPVLDQIIHTPGNLGTIAEHFSDPPASAGPSLGYADGIGVLLRQLNPFRLVGDTLVNTGGQKPIVGTRIPGLVLVLAWVAAAVVPLVLRLRTRALNRLNLVIAIALVLGVFSAARILGEVWFYLVLWAWVLNVLMLLAIGWSIGAFVRSRIGDERTPRLARVGVALIVVATVLVTAAFTTSAARVREQDPRQNATLAHVVPPTIEALEQLERDGARGPYLVTWLPDPLSIGALGYGLLNELIREGYDGRAVFKLRPGATRYHIVSDQRAAKLPVQVHIATGDKEIARWSNDDRFREVARHDPRTPVEQAEYDRTRDELIAQLRAHGAEQALIDQVDENLFTMNFDPNVPPQSKRLVDRMLDLAMPSAVFIGPAGEPPVQP